MRILFVSDTYYPHINGVYYFVCRLAPLLEQKGHEVAVIAPSDTMHYTQKKIDGITVYGMPSVPVFFYPNFRLPLSFRLKSRVNRIVDEFMPDVIHIQDHFLISKTIVNIAGTRKIPVAGTNHFMPENLTVLFHSRMIRNWIEKFSWSQFAALYNQLDLVTTPTETAARLIRPKLNVPVTAVSSGIDLHQFTFGESIEGIRKKYALPEKPVLLFVGRIDPEKRIGDILEAMPLLTGNIDLCLVIAGKGLIRSALERRAQALGIEDRVVFTGFVPDEDLPALYQLSWCFIIASIAELLSLATLQAMACGLPVIAANAGALPELVHGNGFLFEPGDIEAMACSIETLFFNEELYDTMSRKSLEHVLMHDIHAVVSSFEILYRNLTVKESEVPSRRLVTVQ